MCIYIYIYIYIHIYTPPRIAQELRIRLLAGNGPKPGQPGSYINTNIITTTTTTNNNNNNNK